tara:strand:- start:2648 stop:3328 length:681 start_codon:yes stop_codon:yes gene_type:complete
VSADMVGRIRLASASSRRIDWLSKHIDKSVVIEAKPLVGQEKSTEGEVSSQVAFVLDDKISRACMQQFLEKQNSHENDSLSPPEIWVVADTLVEDPNDIYSALGQPDDEISALRMLLDLSGRRHLVWSGTAIIDFRFPEPRIFRFIESAVVEFELLNESVLDELISSGSWKGKAGGYDMAGLAQSVSKLIEGELVTVLGFANKAIQELDQVILHSSDLNSYGSNGS